jgi:hypothetical protein
MGAGARTWEMEAAIRGFFATCSALHNLPSLSRSLFTIAVTFRCRTEHICLMDVISVAPRMSSAAAAAQQ